MDSVLRPLPSPGSVRSALRRLTLSLAALSLAGCSGADSGYLFEFSGIGSVEGQVFLDLDRTGARSGGDTSVRGVAVAHVLRGTRDTLGIAVSDTSGRFFLTDLPPGTYLTLPDPAFMGDSLEITGLTPQEAVVLPSRTTVVSMGLSFPERSIPEIVVSPPGRRLFTRGVALTPPGALGGGVLHLRADGRAVRATQVPSITYAVGDTVLVLGRTQQLSGRIVLSQATSARRIRDGLPAPAPIPVSSAVAATAQGGVRDAELVVVAGAQILQTSTAFGEVTATVTDGSGPLVVRFPTGFLLTLRVDSLVVGTVLEPRGVLVPAPSGPGWELRPRIAADVGIPGVEPPAEGWR
jgi:hypothetical protein